jgi:hypothetical protein
MDLGFIALLFLTSASGLACGWRAHAALPLLLCLHLGAVMALFATLPYGKFAHGVFRTRRCCAMRSRSGNRTPSAWAPTEAQGHAQAGHQQRRGAEAGAAGRQGTGLRGHAAARSAADALLLRRTGGRLDPGRRGAAPGVLPQLARRGRDRARDRARSVGGPQDAQAK